MSTYGAPRRAAASSHSAASSATRWLSSAFSPPTGGGPTTIDWNPSALARSSAFARLSRVIVELTPRNTSARPSANTANFVAVMRHVEPAQRLLVPATRHLAGGLSGHREHVEARVRGYG